MKEIEKFHRRDIDATIQLSDSQISNPTSFLSHMPNRFPESEKGHLLNRLAYYRLFMFGGIVKGNYAKKPGAINIDTDYAVSLYSEFGEPQLVTLADNVKSDDEVNTVLAFCGFRIMRLDPWPREFFKSEPIGIHISQLQAQKFKSRIEEAEMLTFMHYKDIFRHFIEQLSVFISTKNSSINYTFMPKNLYFDGKTAETYTEQQLDRSATIEDFEKSQQLHMERIQKNRGDWLTHNGYHEFSYFTSRSVENIFGIRQDRTHMGTEPLDIGYIKPVSEIVPDNVLQARLLQIYEAPNPSTPQE